jgi:hypothetical protein
LLLYDHPEKGTTKEQRGLARERARERSRVRFADAWVAADRQIELALKREETRKRKQAEEAAAWEHFVRNEQRQLQLRKDGQLARLLGAPLAGGLVALMSGGKTSYKRIDDLEPDDMPARIAANRLRTTWLKERGDGWLGGRAAQS